MLNALQLNTAELNSLVPLPTGAYYLGYPFIQFDGNSLQNDEIISSEIKGWSAPNRDLVSFATPRSDGGGLLSAFFRERRVRVSGILKQATAADLDDAMDDLKRKMKKREGNLDLKFNGVVRRVRATLANPEEMFEDRQSYHLTTCPFRLEFLALEPFWHALVYSSNDPTTYTGLAENPTIEYDGTADAELVTVIIVNAATAITALHLENSTTGEIIEVTPPVEWLFTHVQQASVGWDRTTQPVRVLAPPGG